MINENKKKEILHQISVNEVGISEYTKNLISMNSNKYNRTAELFMLSIIATLQTKTNELRKQLEEA